ncbi:hypothetical protein [Streptomyces sp. NPDC057702]|uniref:hypothetical protein n=1 Tax=unclassified Streptomyces TaxID=2593676 RepID=UPI0036846074
MTVPIAPLDPLGREIDRTMSAAVEALKKKVAEDIAKAVHDITHAAAVKAEASFVKGEAVGASAGLKLFSAEKSLFDVQERLDERAGKGPNALKRAAADAMVEARRANTRLDAIRGQLGGSTPAQQANIGNTGSFTETAAQINRLEGRLNSLVQALG